ncbi:type VII secretion target [Dietzia sp.]|uniref:type VII secretion target n=1 Tax=Dietzia sp. TaxID=1871616 RepID=UPI002FD87E1F
MPDPNTNPASPPPASGGGAPITSMDPQALASVGSDLQRAAAAVQEGLSAYESIPIEELSVALGPVGGEFLAAFDAATTRHRDLLAHSARCVDAAGRLCSTCARSYESLDAWGAGALTAAGPGAGQAFV